MDLLDRILTRRKYRAGARALIITLAAAALYWLSVLVQEREYAWAMVPAVVLAGLSLAEFVVADLVLDARFPRESQQFLEKLQQKLATINSDILRTLNSCVGSFEGCDQSSISSTVHLRIDVVSADRDGLAPALIQLSDYTRPTLGGRRWRVTDPAKGLIGRCLRLGEAVWVNFRSEGDYRRRMVEEFGFSPEEVDKHTTAARSYEAFPIRDRGEMVGVMYFFSTEPQVFPVAASSDRLRDAAESISALLRAAEIL